MNHTEPQLSPDTQAILLLCSALGKKTEKRDIQPLTSLEYAWLAQWLHEQQLRPADLLDSTAATLIKPLAYQNVTASRLLTLLMRKPAMVAAVETWTKQGFWVISRGDKTYPTRLKTRLGHAAPPLLYGIGPSILLQKGGLAIVGTRNTQKEMIDFTKRLTKVAAHQGITVLSGGTRGINTEAILTALAQGRCAVGILADGLAKAAVSSKYRDALQEERLLLMSPFDPQTGFNVGNLLASHKYVYALSDWAVVINSDFEQEGSWAGAMENLRAGWTPLWVRQDENSVGNQQLLSQGAMALDSSILEHTSDLREYLQQLATGVAKPTPLPVTAPTSFQDPKVAEERPSLAIAETRTASSKSVAEKTVSPPKVTELPPVKPPKSIQKQAPDLDQTKMPPDLFSIVWPYLESQLKTEITEDELADRLNLHPGQLKQWLKRAMELGKVKKLTKPVRYVKVVATGEKQPSLF